MNRRGFLGAILAAGVAPVFIPSSRLMRLSGLIVPQTELILPQTGLIVPEFVRKPFPYNTEGWDRWVAAMKDVQALSPEAQWIVEEPEIGASQGGVVYSKVILGIA